jgi:hypothetical protein
MVSSQYNSQGYLRVRSLNLVNEFAIMKGLLGFQGGRFVGYGDVKKGGAVGVFLWESRTKLAVDFLVDCGDVKEGGARFFYK